MGVSTHILNTALGRPAAGVGVTFEVHHCGAWVEVLTAVTDVDGRCKEFLPDGYVMEAAVYRIRFDTATYYAGQEVEGLYPVIEITFSVTNSMQHYHIPLLLTANGYTTYRGS